MTRHATADKQLVVVNDSRVSSSSSWRDAVDFRLSPVCSGEVKDDDIREVRSMFILTSEDEQLVALPETRGMA